MGLRVLPKRVLMATNTGLKRDPVKYIRDGIKSNYKRKDYCEVCDATENIELHHYHTVSFILENYAKDKGLSLSTKDSVLAMRDDFYKAHWHELVEDTVSLCNHHHTLLHKIYGQKPLLYTADKQRIWVKKQYDKAHGLLVEETPVAYTSGISSYLIPTSGSLLRFMV